MAYSSLAEVKEVLRIDIADTGSDSELTICITSADALIDNILKYWGFTVPLSPTPTAINNASKHFAAWIFRMRGAPPAEAQPLFKLGMQFLDAYVDAEKRQPYVGMV